MVAEKGCEVRKTRNQVSENPVPGHLQDFPLI